MIRERLKDMDIKLTELANYVGVSRPTMYKFIEAYENDNKELINASLLKLFDYISNNELIGKNNVIAYILNNLTKPKEADIDEVNQIIDSVKQYVRNNPSSEKTQFITKCTSSNDFDIAIHYLMEIASIQKKNIKDNGDLEKIELYNKILGIYLNASKENE